MQKELISLDRQLNRLKNKQFRISVFGRVGVGKSSILNALLEEQIFSASVINGSTRRTQVAIWNQPIKNLNSIELVDSPGFDEINSTKNIFLTSKLSKNADLILLVLDSDITSIEQEFLNNLLKSGNPILLVLNRCDQWEENEISKLKEAIRSRLPANAKNLTITTIAAAPRESQLLSNGKVRSRACTPEINSLREVLIKLLEKQGELFLGLNALRRADDFYYTLKELRLQKGKSAAQSVIGKYAAAKASGVAISPILILDITAGLACDTALLMELSKLYGIQLRGPAARKLLKRLSLYNTLLGGIQLSFQLILSILRHVLIIASPLTSGLSLIPAAPIALLQAAFAIHTTKLTGRLAAREFLRGSNHTEIQPRAMLKRLAKTDPEIKGLLEVWPESISVPIPKKSLRTLLP